MRDAPSRALNNTRRSFPRSARLLTAADYSQVFKKCQRYSDRYWTVLVRRREEKQPRLGLAVAKKKAKRAIDRNRIKRVARECFRLNLEALGNCELVIMNRDAAAKADKPVLRSSLDSLIRKIAGKSHQ